MNKTKKETFSAQIKTDPSTYRRFKMLCAIFEKPIAAILGEMVKNYVRKFENFLPPEGGRKTQKEIEK